jgi:glycine/D-amino acid oxidase-like deaminating enzyme
MAYRSSGYRSISFWHDSVDDDLTARGALPGDLSVDVAIVGAGLTGLWTAYYLLQREPTLRIVVLEKHIAGYGASGRNSGWCSSLFPASTAALEREHGRAAALAMRRAMIDTVDEAGRVTGAEGIDCDLARGGTLSLALAGAARGGAGGSRRGTAVRGRRRTAAVHVDRRRRRGHARPRLRPPPSRRTRARTRAPAGVARRDHPRADRGARLGAAHGHDQTFTDYRHLLVYGQRTADNRFAFGGRGARYHWGSSIREGYDRDPRVFDHLRAALVELFPQAAYAAVTHRWGGPLGVHRDWHASAAYDRATGIARAGGYVGDGLSTTNLAGRTLADLITATPSPLTRLPWVNHSSPRWEREPLRFAGANLGLAAMSIADAEKRMTGRRSLAARVMAPLVGR